MCNYIYTHCTQTEVGYCLVGLFTIWSDDNRQSLHSVFPL